MKKFEEEYLLKVASDEIAKDGFSPWVEIGTTQKDWLLQAVQIEPRLVTKSPPIDELADFLLRTVPSLPKVSATKIGSRNRYALKMVLLNLLIAHATKVPIYVSRNKNSYNHDARYGRLYFKYGRMMGILDALTESGDIAQFKGYRDPVTQKGKMTRIYPKEALVERFIKDIPLDNFDFIELEPTGDVIQLRNSMKVDIGYKDNDFTNGMRTKLELYNDYIANHEVMVDLNYDTQTSINSLNDLCNKLTKNRVKLVQLEVEKELIEVPYNEVKVVISGDSNHNRYIVNDISYVQKSISSITNPFWKIYDEDALQDLRKESRELGKFFISNIKFVIPDKSLHRVFNDGSWESGGRHYGSYHQSIKKSWRKTILINGNTVLEPDFVAHHVRLLYNMEGIDYREDPYEAPAECEGERDLFKKIILIALNAKNGREAYGAISDDFEDDAVCLPPGTTIGSLLKRFKKAHKPIAKYIHSGMGTTLQNLDSRITENILDKLTHEDIPCLPVHDSYVVEARHVGKAQEAMEEEYEKVMGFKPVIKVG